MDVEEDGGEDLLESSTAQAEEKWSRRCRVPEGKSSGKFVGKYQQPPKKQLKIETM